MSPRAQTSQRPGALAAWALAMRPRTLPAALAPVVVGSAIAYAEGGFRALPAAAAATGAALIQVATNLVNDSEDYARGTDTEHRIGPNRAAQAGWISVRALRIGAALVFGAAGLCGAYLATVAGWPVVLFGILSLAAGVSYSAGPVSLAHRGLGDPFVFVFFGLVGVLGTVYVQTLTTPPIAWLAAIPVGALTTAILVVNNVRDMNEDARAGRTTIPVVFGRRAGLVELGLLVALAYTAPLLMAARFAPLPVLLPLVSLPLAVRIVLRVCRRTDGPALNAALAATARLTLLFSTLLALGIAIAPWAAR